VIETKTIWFRWIARNAHYMFWTIWGAGLGAFGSVLVRAVDAGGDALRVYMGVLTVMMGGALGLISSRAMDQLNDERKRQRAINVALAEIGGLIRQWQRFMTIFGPSRLLVAPIDAWHIIEDIEEAAEHLPDFDDLIDSVADTDQAYAVLDAFRFSRRAFKAKPESRTEETMRAYLSELREERNWDRHCMDIITSLVNAGRHFDMRRGQFFDEKP
jgi:hypothetical protein